MSTREILSVGMTEWGLELSPEALNAFEVYASYLAEQNAVMDLTAVSGEAETAKRHFLDSLSLLRVADFHGKRVIDVGSGAGFPGLPLKIAVPDMALTLLDAQQKRVDFLASLCEKIGADAECLHARAEEQALKPEYREGYDYAVSRAVAQLNQLCELTLPFVKVGGALLAMKAKDCAQEVKEAENAMKTLGAALETVESIAVGDIERSVVIIRKVSPTPAGSPRRFARIQKKPL